MEAISQSTPRFSRALILLFGLAASLYLFVIGVFKNINSVSDILVEANDKGGIIFKVAKRSGYASDQKYA